MTERSQWPDWAAILIENYGRYFGNSTQTIAAAPSRELDADTADLTNAIAWAISRSRCKYAQNFNVCTLGGCGWASACGLRPVIADRKAAQAVTVLLMSGWGG